MLNNKILIIPGYFTQATLHWPDYVQKNYVKRVKMMCRK